MRKENEKRKWEKKMRKENGKRKWKKKIKNGNLKVFFPGDYYGADVFFV